MSPVSGSASSPLLTPRQAGLLLDDVIFTRVVSLIDLPELYDLEALLALQIESLGEDRESARGAAKSMIDRALERVARTPRRWTLHGSPQGGSPANGEPNGSAARDPPPREPVTREPSSRGSPARELPQRTKSSRRERPPERSTRGSTPEG